MAPCYTGTGPASATGPPSARRRRGKSASLPLPTSTATASRPPIGAAIYSTAAGRSCRSGLTILSPELDRRRNGNRTHFVVRAMLQCSTMMRTNSFISSFVAGGAYTIACSLLLEVIPAWWELALVCGIGTFCSPVVWTWILGMWQVVLEARPENRFEDERTQATVDQILVFRGEPRREPLPQNESLRLAFFCLNLFWLFASRGLLNGTALWAIQAWFSA